MPRSTSFLTAKILPVPGMILLLLMATPRGSVAQQSREPNCITCHRELDGGPEVTEGIVHDFTMSAHAEAGLSCVDCHGGNPVPAADLDTFDYTPAKGPGTGFRGAPSKADMPAFCGRCHSDPAYMRRFDPQIRVDQERLFWTSGHGNAIRNGSTHAASCSDCHTAHRILPASDPRSTVAARNVPGTCITCHDDATTMAGTGHSTSIGVEYAGSVHGMALLDRGDVGAPACNDCHGNHGAAPPGFSSVSAVCSRCHVSNAEDLRASPHGPVFEMMELAACEVCHGNHAVEPTADEMLAEDGICATCHVPGDAGFGTAAAMRAEIERLERAIGEADSLLEAAHRKGIIVEEGQFVLRRAENGLVRGRAAVHTFAVDGLREVTGPGLEAAAEAGSVGLTALEEFDRRRGGWVVFLILAVLTLAGLAGLVKYLERPGGPYPLRNPGA